MCVCVCVFYRIKVHQYQLWFVHISNEFSSWNEVTSSSLHPLPGTQTPPDPLQPIRWDSHVGEKCTTRVLNTPNLFIAETFPCCLVSWACYGRGVTASCLYTPRSHHVQSAQNWNPGVLRSLRFHVRIPFRLTAPKSACAPESWSNHLQLKPFITLGFWFVWQRKWLNSSTFPQN